VRLQTCGGGVEPLERGRTTTVERELASCVPAGSQTSPPKRTVEVGREVSRLFADRTKDLCGGRTSPNGAGSHLIDDHDRNDDAALLLVDQETELEAVRHPHDQEGRAQRVVRGTQTRAAEALHVRARAEHCARVTIDQNVRHDVGHAERREGLAA